MKQAKDKTNYARKCFIILVSILLALTLIVNILLAAYYPGNKTYKSGTRWRPNPAWKNGLNTTYTLGQNFLLQNISYNDHSLVMMKDNIGYWINVTSGANLSVTVNKWFETSDPSIELQYQTSGTFNTRLYVGSKPKPTSVTGVSSWEWDAANHSVNFTMLTPDTVQIFWEGGYDFAYTFRGPFDEATGLRIYENVTVTAYFIGAENATESFVLNGTYLYTPSFQPYYFHFELGEKDREYWISPSETSASIYVFNQTLTTYTVQFLDLAGALNKYPFVEARRYVNGTLRTVEKRKVDVEKKLQFNLMQGSKYTIEIKNGANYTFGDLLFTSETKMTLTLKGIEFPQDIILAYRYNRIYAYRHNNQSSISIIYEDTQGNSANVKIDILYENKTSVGGIYPYTYIGTTSFNHTWASAVYNTTYIVQVTITHSKYGEIHYNTVLARAWRGQPWKLPFGSIGNINTANLIPIILIFACFLIFSQINAPTGAFIGTGVATLLTWLGWIPIPSPLLVAAWVFTILFGLAHARRRG